MLDVNDRISDGNVFQSSWSKSLKKSLLNFPKSQVMADGQNALPHTAVADNSFPLTPFKWNLIQIVTSLLNSLYLTTNCQEQDA